MSRKLAGLLLLAVQTDRQATIRDGVWETRCLHCRAKLWLRADGVALNDATLEHVVPQSWFEKRTAQEIIGDLDGPNDARNLALSCPRCNQGKGSRHDARGPSNARAIEVVTMLKNRRMERFRPVESTENETTSPGCDG